MRTRDGGANGLVSDSLAHTLHRAIGHPLARVLSAVVCALAGGTQRHPVAAGGAAGVGGIVALLARVEDAVTAAIGRVLMER